ncbi:hypothetical protein JD969_12850 [Planctomycetota bacterium]|nr:hypothetical protein JD969_12850 [Planctomycetota bacterium]
MTTKQVLNTARIIWAGLVIGITVIAIVFTFAIGPSENITSNTFIFELIPFILLPIVPTIGFFVRSFIFKQNTLDNGTVDKNAYVTGNIIFWGTTEAICVITLVFSFFTAPIFPTIIPSIIAYIILITAFPTGSQLKPKLHQKIGNLDI